MYQLISLPSTKPSFLLSHPSQIPSKPLLYQFCVICSLFSPLSRSPLDFKQSTSSWTRKKTLETKLISSVIFRNVYCGTWRL